MIKYIIILLSLIIEIIHCGIPFDVGEELSYTFKNDVTFKDLKNGQNFTYRIQGQFEAGCIWGVTDVKLLRFKLTEMNVLAIPYKHKRVSSKINTTTKTNQYPIQDESPLGDDSYKIYYPTSEFANAKKDYFYANWNNGDINKYFFNTANEHKSIQNLKKAIISLFQYKDMDGEYKENDISGNCDVKYTTKKFTNFKKVKTNCKPLNDDDDEGKNGYQSSDEPFKRFENVLGITIQSKWITEYKTSADATATIIRSKEKHHIFVESHPNAGGLQIESVNFVKVINGSRKNITVDDMVAVKMLANAKHHLTLISEPDDYCGNFDCLNLKQGIKLFKDDLQTNKIGTASMALAYAKLIPIARRTSKDEFLQIFNAHSTKEIKGQLIDLLGATQTKQSHKAAKDLLKFTDTNDWPMVERYLQALAVGTRPTEYLINGLLKLLTKSKDLQAPLIDTLIQTIGSMTRRFALNNGNDEKRWNIVIVENVTNELKKRLSECRVFSKCKDIYIRGLQNLQSPKTIEILIDLVLNSNERLTTVTAMKALRSFPIAYWTADHQQHFNNIFWQSKKRFDSSVRTLAIDILLELKPNKEKLQELLEYLKSFGNNEHRKSFEIKQYLLQHILMLAEKCKIFKKNLLDILKLDKSLNNYHIIGQKGLSTALSRQYSKTPAFNGTLLSVQEMYGGILKRGIVDMTIESNKQSFNLFTLGLYSGGLSSFMSTTATTSTTATDVVDDDNIFPDDDDQSATAGMEIIVQNSYLRPLQFFNGQAELMGHVWSGTASEATPAYTATTILHDYQQYLRLENGAVLKITINGAVSIDLNGQIQISLWNRNAHCQVDKKVGIAITGTILLDTHFIGMRSRFEIMQEPIINLVSDIDFSDDPLLCMQLSQPDGKLNYTIVKEQTIPKTLHKISNTMKFQHDIAGRTFALNPKNNEMCNNINS